MWQMPQGDLMEGYCRNPRWRCWWLDGSNGDGEKCLNSGCVLKVKSTVFPDKLVVGYERQSIQARLQAQGLST